MNYDHNLIVDIIKEHNIGAMKTLTNGDMLKFLLNNKIKVKLSDIIRIKKSLSIVGNFNIFDLDRFFKSNDFIQLLKIELIYLFNLIDIDGDGLINVYDINNFILAYKDNKESVVLIDKIKKSIKGKGITLNKFIDIMSES
jgi:hypothetical protein